MKFKKSLLFAAAALLASQAAFSYSAVDRFTLLDDKLKTDAMMRPIDHDFIFDIGVSLNKNLLDVVNDISDASKTNNVTTATNTLAKYSNTEQAIKLNLTLGIPVFSFGIGELKLRPNIRAYVDVGANIGIRSDTFTAADIAALFPVSLPADLVTFLSTLSPGTDVIVACNASSLSTSTKAFCATQPTGKYLIPATGAPSLAFFAKLDGKVGLFNDYTYGEHFFGNFNLYGLSRTDLYQTASATSIAKGTKIELPTKKNTETSAQLDYRLGYKNDNYRASVSVEDIKLAVLKERATDSRELAYKYAALIRLHGEADYRFTAFSLMPFAGVHKRSGYGFADGVYGGAMIGAHLWGDRLGLMVRGQLDKQYITIAPRIKLWLMQIEYSLKAPVKSTDGDVKLSAIQSIDFRLFF